MRSLRAQKNKMNIVDRFDDAVDYLYATNNYLAAEVTRLGYPKIDNGIPTAGVAWNKDRKRIEFLFNEKFSSSLTKEEFAFVVAHEAVHVLNCHVFHMKDRYDNMKMNKKTNLEIYKFQRKFNIAADCVVNDTLTMLYGLPKVMSEPVGDKPGIIYGMPTVKCDCHDMTVYEVMSLLESQMSDDDGSGDDHGTWQSFMNPDGSINKDFVDSVKKFLDDKMQNSSLSDEDASKIQKMKDDLSNSSDSYASEAGTSAGGNSRSIDLSDGALKWNKLLFNLVDSKKDEDTWSKASSKLISVYPDVILPSAKQSENYDVFVAVDSSSSIDHAALSLFASLLKNTPKNFNIKSISFDTACYEYDIKKDDKPKGGGGTNFQIIEDYIQANFKKYPKAIFVLTDGHGSPITPQFPKRWCWILYGSYSTDFCSTMKYYDIKSVLK